LCLCFLGAKAFRFFEQELMKSVFALTLTLLAAAAQAQETEIARGSQIYAKNCATCHGARMVGPEWAIDLKTFPKDERARFIDAVTHGKGGMPPWGDVLKPDEIAALWTYVLSGGEGR
jgi:mono/diheme cytochrome c family protein